MLMIANPGVARGDPRKPATVDQSRAVTESFHIYPASKRRREQLWMETNSWEQCGIRSLIQGPQGTTAASLGLHWA